jgi:hypothetical protein
MRRLRERRLGRGFLLPRGVLARASVVVVLAMSALLCGPSAGATTAIEARSVRLTITAHLHYVSSKGSYLIEEGPASGQLAGTVKARLRVTAEISGSFTLYLAPHGASSISGQGSGTLHESGTYASFGGSLKILGGTGRYAHGRGGGKLYGVYNRKNLGVTIQTIGNLSY